ncbi:DsbA family protein [Thermodesulfovibrio yellowstonii]|uniref:DsbA family protein n=1 Tax=Thermodesulfovibrio yellowstonii TaxID=28262 RepID=UPI0024B38A32|nr:thioredoxin domain-containing protein [Thermodesulfovibrio yellowstonii]MDI6864923.1 thioredoxin domain-containing protein [Thermodesulfovibrio yellowstonii]
MEVGPTIDRLVKELEGKVKLVIKFFPYRYRDYSRIAAEAAVEAWKQGKFTEMHDLLIKNSPKLDRESLIKYAKELNMDIEKFIKAINNQEGASIIEKDLKLAKELDLYVTPAFYINGIKVLGVRDSEYFKEIIFKELENVKKK